MPKYKIDIIDLPYQYDALEPYIAKDIIYYSYEKHTKEYLNSLKKIMTEHNEIFKNFDSNSPGHLNQLVANYCDLKDNCAKTHNHGLGTCNDKKLQGWIRQYAGGLINQNFFLSSLAKGKNFNPESASGEAIIKKFKTFDAFCQQLIDSALSIFGSGWVWLVIDNNDNLRIYKTFNQDNPWFLHMTPLLAISVWEHSYYLQYKNERKEYISALLNVINWDQIEVYYQEYLTKKTENNKLTTI